MNNYQCPFCSLQLIAAKHHNNVYFRCPTQINYKPTNAILADCHYYISDSIICFYTPNYGINIIKTIDKINIFKPDLEINAYHFMTDNYMCPDLEYLILDLSDLDIVDRRLQMLLNFQ